MSDSRWQQIKALLEAAVERPPSERAAFLVAATGGDETLRREVESLLEWDTSAAGFTDRLPVRQPLPQADHAESATSSEATRAALSIGVGPYRVVGLLGVGGMGEVFRARDTKLHRDVALKMLPSAFESDPDRLARFRREARVLAALNHPHIAAIYGLEESNSRVALVLELVEGSTLARRIEDGALALADALSVARQIAEALEAAHDKGIIHRDLKPANVKVTPAGVVKVLDFGLAKTAAGDLPPTAAFTSSAIAGETRVGTVLGTAAYMSPEQARGEEVDARSDVWAFGCIVYEMLTGRRVFDGRTAAESMAKVLEEEPDWTALPREMTPAVGELLRRCLTKNPGERIENMSRVRALLDVASAPGVTKRVWLVAIGVAVLVVTASAFAGYRWWNAPPVPTTADVSTWEQLTNFADSATQPALSADGRMVTFIRGEDTFATAGQVYLKHLPSGEPAALTHDELKKMDPVFSADGNRIAYTVTGDTRTMGPGWDTWVVPVVRGEPRLWLANTAGLTFIGAGQILFSEIKGGGHMGLVTAAENRSGARALYFPAHENGMAHRSARSPDGQWVLTAEMNDLSVFTSCRLIPFDGRSSGRLVGPDPARCTNVAWSPNGRFMYFSADAGDGMHLWRQGFPDAKPEQLTSGAATLEEGLAVAPDGKSIVTSVGQQRRGVWVRDASGERQISQEGYAYWPLLSGDGRRMAFRVTRGIASGNTASELWVADLPSGRFERLLPGHLVTQYDLSRDDRIVAVVREADGKGRLWVASMDPRDPPRPLGIESGSARIGRDGQILFRATRGASDFLFETTVDGATPRQISARPIGTVLGAISPDGQWSSDFKGGQLLAISMTGAAVPILKGSVARLRWTRDGTRVLIGVQSGPGPSAFGFGSTYELPVTRGSMLPQTPPGGFASEQALAAWPGVRVSPYGDFADGPNGMSAFSKITVSRNLYRIPIR
jgi:Tol biopolymer transport system component